MTPAQDATALADALAHLQMTIEGTKKCRDTRPAVYTFESNNPITIGDLRAIYAALRVTSQTPDAVCCPRCGLDDSKATIKWNCDNPWHRAAHIRSTPSTSAGPQDRSDLTKALEADGEKLEQLTGEDHGPRWMFGEATIYAGERDVADPPWNPSLSAEDLAVLRNKTIGFINDHDEPWDGCFSEYDLSCLSHYLAKAAPLETENLQLRRALIAIRDRLWRDNETYDERIGDLKWLAQEVLAFQELHRIGDLALKYRDASAAPQTEAMAMEHGRNCPALGGVGNDGCTCGLRYRIELQTEREMHNAWRKRAEEAEAASAGPQAGKTAMTEDQIKYMVDRFLGWKLPKDFTPDCGIVFNAPSPNQFNPRTPYGTNLFDATQADVMVRYLIDGMPSSAVPQAEAVIEALDKTWRSIISHPFSKICKHLIAANILSDIESLGGSVPAKLAKAVVECDDVTSLAWPALYAHPQPQQADGRGAVIGPYKGPMTVDAGLLHALWCYGTLDPVTGVLYSYGTHQRALDDADKLLYDRAQSIQQSPATDGPAK